MSQLVKKGVYELLGTSRVPLRNRMTSVNQQDVEFQKASKVLSRLRD